MILNKTLAQQTAEYLLQINAIKLNPENPFTWASGWKSPIYCDNRIALSFPKVRDFLSKVISEKIKKDFEIKRDFKSHSNRQLLNNRRTPAFLRRYLTLW